MKELVVISGKGGTGKTSVTASLAVLADRPVLADCDVDAADLHLVLAPEVLERHEFRSGREAVIRQADCIRCGACLAYCRFEAVRRDGQGAFSIDPIACEGCGVCVRFCPVQAIDFPERVCGEWMISRTRCGPMVHARLGAGGENSGKLVSVVRQEARKIAGQDGHNVILVDGPPGIGCPVIASMTGSSAVLVVTEPTVSGGHDLQRVVQLARHFEVPAFVCVNKWDINPDMTERIRDETQGYGARWVGQVPYDPLVTASQIQRQSVVEHGDGPAARAIRKIWEDLCLEIM